MSECPGGAPPRSLEAGGDSLDANHTGSGVDECFQLEDSTAASGSRLPGGAGEQEGAPPAAASHEPPEKDHVEDEEEEGLIDAESEATAGEANQPLTAAKFLTESASATGSIGACRLYFSPPSPGVASSRLSPSPSVASWTEEEEEEDDDESNNGRALSYVALPRPEPPPSAAEALTITADIDTSREPAEASNRGDTRGDGLRSGNQANGRAEDRTAPLAGTGGSEEVPACDSYSSYSLPPPGNWEAPSGRREIDSPAGTGDLFASQHRFGLPAKKIAFKSLIQPQAFQEGNAARSTYLNTGSGPRMGDTAAVTGSRWTKSSRKSTSAPDWNHGDGLSGSSGVARYSAGGTQQSADVPEPARDRTGRKKPKRAEGSLPAAQAAVPHRRNNRQPALKQGEERGQEEEAERESSSLSALPRKRERRSPLSAASPTAARSATKVSGNERDDHDSNNNAGFLERKLDLERELEIGDRVYAEWYNGEWFYGNVMGKYWNKGRHRYKRMRYDVKFDDGDERYTMDRKMIYTIDEQECLEGFEAVQKEAKDRKQKRKAYPIPDIGTKAEPDAEAPFESPETERPGATEDTKLDSVSTLAKGDRVYAFYPPESRWYWGVIDSVRGSGAQAKYEVLFDDNYKCRDLKPCHVCSEIEYRSSTHCHYTVEELHAIACRECSMCMKKDCGRCKSCRDTNAIGGSTRGKVCLFKMCLKIPDEKKAQMIPGYFPHARFVVTEPRLVNRALRRKRPIHPQLAGFYIIYNGKAFRGIETHSKYVHALNRDKIVTEMYKDLFDVDLDEQVKDHVLLGRPWMREWVDSNLAKRGLEGTVTAAYQEFSSTDSPSHHFTIDYNERSLTHVNRGLDFVELVIPKCASNVKEEVAYSGCVYADQFGLFPSTGLTNTSIFPYRWIVPDSIVDRLQNDAQRTPCRIVKCMGHIFEINVKPSRVSGMGAFLTVYPVQQHWSKDSTFSVEAGSLIDLGVYAPLRTGDLLPDEVAVTKNFVTGDKAEVYSFACQAVPGHAFDITEARTGELHEEARQSVLTYVNEISDPGKEVPTIRVEADPSGSIHYLLGNPERKILIQYGQEMELKADYGYDYEKVRVRHGYPRVVGETLEQKRREIASDDETSLTEILTWDVKKVGRCIDFFVSNWEDYSGPVLPTPTESLERLLLVMVILHARMKRHVDESQSDRSIECHHAIDRAKQLVESILDAFTPSRYRSLLESDLSRKALGLVFRDLDDSALKELPPSKLSRHLLNM